MNNTTDINEESNGGISNNFRLILSFITTLPVCVNIFYVTVCFKVMKKKFHNLLVLMLCIGDSILSLALTMFSLTKLSNALSTNVHLCLFQTFTVCYGLAFTYNIVFLVCCERYYVVKNYNFGVQQFFERFKFVIIAGSLALQFMFTIENVMFVNHEKTIESCTVPNLYGKHMNLFLIFIASWLTMFMAFIIVFSLKTSHLIWKLFFKVEKVEPSGLSEHLHSEATTSNHYNSHEVKYTTDETRKSIERSTEMNNKVRELVTKLKKDRMGSIFQSLEVNKNTTRKTKPTAWERRAFVTTIIIAVSTICLTGPFIFSFWLDYFYGARFTSQLTRLILFIPLVLNSIINPFIYAWRIPEIKQTIRKIFKCGQ